MNDQGIGENNNADLGGRNNINNNNIGDEQQQQQQHVPPHQMQLSAEERGWAREIMQWIEGPMGHADGMTPLSHFDYVLYAFITQGNTQEAIHRAKAVQTFRENYKVLDTVEDGVTAIQNYIRLCPGSLLHVQSMGPGGFACAMDMSKNLPNLAMESIQNWKIHAQFFYYIHRILGPNFDVMRGGVCALLDCAGMSWDNINMEFEQQMMEEYWRYETVHFRQMRFFNTNSIANLFYSLVKPFMPAQWKRVVSLGCQIEPLEMMFPNAHPLLYVFLPTGPKKTLQDFYLQPTYEVAMQNLINNCRSLLEERYHNERTFQL